MKSFTNVANRIGTIFATYSLRSDCLLCNGINISPITYALLFAEIGTTFGGDGVTSFLLPDLRGLFLRGSGTSNTHLMANGGRYAGGTVGTFSYDSFQGHTHTVTRNNRAKVAELPGPGVIDGGTTSTPFNTDGSSLGNYQASDTTAFAMSLVYGIKYTL